MKKIYLLLLLVIFSAGAFAQAVLIAANPSTSGLIVVGQSNYHASESIYLNSEIGNNNFTTAGSAIQQIFFLLAQTGLSTSISNYSIYMKNVPAATTTFAGNGTYSLLGYTLVFNGTYTATPVGFSPIVLTTPFIHTAGMNIQVLIIRSDNVLHTGYVYQAAVANETDATGTLNTSRRYNSTIVPAAGSTMLAATNFRPAIVFNHTFAIDAVANDIILPRISCHNTPQSIDVEVFNGGTLPIAAGAVNVTFKVRGANTYTASLNNTAIIPSFGSEFITFTGINLNNQGFNFDTAYVSLASDGTTWNDTITTAAANAAVISTFPVTENVEEFYPIVPTSDLDVFRYTEVLQFDELWGLWHGDYFNDDQTAHLVPLGWPVDSAFYLYDSYSGTSSDGFESRLFSECVDLTSATAALLSFQMSHDNVFVTTLDSIYVSISADRGVTWTRVQGFQRPDATALTPTWRLHSINLAAYLGQTIQIGFEGVSKYGNAIALDNITITATLPVTVLSFNAQRNGRVNDLNWRTAQELNSSRFVIERSTDGGLHYTDIGQVAAAGNSNTERNYSFTDRNPVKGINYYRLRIVDLDNKVKYSEVRNVKNLGTSDMVFANPVQQRMDIKLDVEKADKAAVSIMDMNGKVIYSNAVSVSEGSNNLSLETGKFAPGLYIIQVQLSDNRITRKFSKL